MKTFLLIIIAYLAFSLQTHAQTYPSTDGNGNKIYYRIVNANHDYANKCIQDNTSNSTYTFFVNDYDASSTKQQFELVANPKDPSQYYFRNRSSRKYFRNMFVTKDLFNFIKPTADKSDAVLVTVTPLGNNQVTLKLTGSDGLTYFLNAADANSINQRVFSEDALDSRYAWYIIDATLDPSTGIEAARIAPDINAYCQNRHIYVTGCTNYSVHDLTGKEIPSTGYYSPGIYIVRTPGKNFKISVK